MLRYDKAAIIVPILPSEITNDLSTVIEAKLHQNKNKYSVDHKYFIENIEKAVIPKYGITSRTNFIVTFKVCCEISYIKLGANDTIWGILQSTNQYGIFFKNKYSKAIVPKLYYTDSNQFQTGKEYELVIIEARYKNDGISCICKFKNVCNASIDNN